MTHRIRFQAGWGGRPESVHEGARRIQQTLKGIRECMPDLVLWSATPPPFTPVSVLSEDLARLISSRTAPGDVGFGLVLWAGKQDASFGLTVNFGSTSKRVLDRVTLKFPAGWKLSTQVTDCVLGCLVRSWEPDWAALNPVEHEGKQLLKLGERSYVASALDQRFPELSRLSRVPFASGNLYEFTRPRISEIYARTNTDFSAN